MVRKYDVNNNKRLEPNKIYSVQKYFISVFFLASIKIAATECVIILICLAKKVFFCSVYMNIVNKTWENRKI